MKQSGVFAASKDIKPAAASAHFNLETRCRCRPFERRGRGIPRSIAATRTTLRTQQPLAPHLRRATSLRPSSTFALRHKLIHNVQAHRNLAHRERSRQ